MALSILTFFFTGFVDPSSLDLGRNFLQNLPKWKIEQPYSVLARIWGSSGVSWSLLGAVLRDLGHKLGYVGQSWGYVGTFLAACWGKDAEDEPR